MTWGDHSLVGDADGSSGISNGYPGNIVGGNYGNPVINALLGPLQNNGGPTQTMALLAGSPAIGHADNFALGSLTDQRGVTRLDLAGETTDMGAFELTGPGSASATTFSLTPLGTAPAAGIPVNVLAAEVTPRNVANPDAHVVMVPFNNTDVAVRRTSDVILRTTPLKSGTQKIAAADELFAWNMNSDRAG